MGRRLNTSTPTVINTELVPLDESFFIDTIGETEQWYYDNSNQYKPNRTTNPLTLIPRVSVCDGDSQESYEPTLQYVRWYEKHYDSTQGAYVETEITNETDSSSAEYVKVGNNLLVKKNVGYSHDVTIRCSAQYTDPRDSGVAYETGDSVTLITNRDATKLFPKLDVHMLDGKTFNPLVNVTENNGALTYDSEFRLKAVGDFSGMPTGGGTAYKADPLGTEEIVPQNDTDGVVTVAPTIDIRYGDVEQYDQTFMRRQTGGGGLSAIDGNKAYLQKVKGNSVAWMQLINPSNGGERNGLTYTWSGGACHVYGRSTERSNVRCHKNDIYCQASQKFYISGAPSGSSQSTYKITANEYNSAEYLRTTYVLQNTIFTTVDNCNKLNVEIVGAQSGNQTVDVVFTPTLINLTLMFGAGNEPTTVEAFEAWLAANVGQLDYYPYNAGELVNVKMTGIKTIGFNQWDEQWINGVFSQTNGEAITTVADIVASKNKIPIIEGTAYYLKFPIKPRFFLYDKNGVFITSVTNVDINRVHTFESGVGYIRFQFTGSVYGNNVCINISNATKNGTYEAYWSKTAPFDPRKVYGKLNGAGSMVQVAANGISSVGEVADEINIGKRIENRYVGISDATIKVGSRAYQSGDESDTSVITDGTTTFYPLSTELHYTDCMYSVDGGETFMPLDRIVAFEWYAISNNTEVKADTLPWYKNGQNTDVLTVDAMYSEDIRVILRAGDPSEDTLYPDKIFRNIVWRIPDVDANIQSDNGSAIRSDSKGMDFRTIVNARHNTLSDAVKKDNLRFNWKTRKDNSSEVTDLGWGQEKHVDKDTLKNTHLIQNSPSFASTLVYNEVNLLGAYEEVTLNSAAITENGETVYDRTL